MEISKEVKETLDKLQEETGSKFNVKYTIDQEELMYILEESLGTILKLEEMLLDLSRDVEDNYKPITKEEQIYG